MENLYFSLVIALSSIALASGQILGPWSAFSACSATCYVQGDAVPTQIRTRTCTGACTGLSTVETNQCNVGNICNLLSEWGTWTSCSASCTVDSNNPPQRFRTRTCSFSVNNCNNAQVFQSNICNTQICADIGLRCSNANLSYVIVMDSSSSVSTGQPDVPNSDEWSQEKAFVKHFAQEIGIETNKNVRVAIVNFGQEAEIVATCEDPRTQNLQQFNTLIDNLPRKLGGTAIHDALTKSRQLYTSGGCGRQNEIRIILFLTDGYENIDFDVPKQIALEEQVRAEATIFIGAIGPETRESELLRIVGGRQDLLVQTNNFQDLEGLDTKFIVPVILIQSGCKIDGLWGEWGSWGSCTITCGATGTRQRSRTCNNPTTLTASVTCPIGSSNDIGSCFDGDCQGTLSQWSAYGQCSESCHSNTNINNPPQQSRTRQCLGATGAGNCNGAVLFEVQPCQVQTPCPGSWGLWGSYGICSEACQSNVLVPPIQTRTRVCVRGTWNGDCPAGETTQSTDCNVGLPCQGTLTQWSAFGACSASCQLGLAAPTYSRTRQCVGNTFGGNCNGGILSQVSDCNVVVSCPGQLSQWATWGTCSETCQSNTAVAPKRNRVRTCTNNSFGGNCGGAALQETADCNIAVPCAGGYGPWGSYGQCSESCQSNINVPPTQTRTRVCSGGTFGGGCTGQSSETINCNVAVPCQGTLTQWSAYGACSASCQLGLTAPTYSRTRQCVGNTFGGNCNAGVLSQVSDCNVEVSCPGDLSQWGAWGTCSETCQSNTAVAPTRQRFRTCSNGSYGGNCGGVALSDTGNCMVSVPCPGSYGAWGSFGQCSESCQSNTNVAPTQTRTRVCSGGTFGGGCTGPSSETINCNAAVPCQGTLTQWSAYGACSASCQLGLTAPTYSRTRQCVGNTFGGNCNAGVLSQVSDCNVEVSCPGDLSQWGAWGTCSETCQSNTAVAPTRQRFRTCSNGSYGGNCGGVALSDTGNCMVSVPCPGSYGAWGSFGQCSESCQSNTNVAPTQTRTRVCSGGTFGGGCTGPSSETINCNAAVPCQGTLTQWSAYGACSASCQLGLTAPTYSRTRQCVGNTFGGNCNAGVLSQVSDCNVEVSCPGDLSQWGAWGTCSETCQSNTAVAPTRQRFRTCSNGSYGGNCGGVALSDTGNCMVSVPCPGSYGAWGSFGQCSESCQSNTNVAPTQTRTRVCSGGTFGGGCTGPSSETINCNAAVPCQGTLTQWSAYGACSASCQLGLTAPTYSRTRQCVGNTFGGNCNAGVLSQVSDCNVEVSCPGDLSQWGAWGTCSETCQSNTAVAPTRQRFRTCSNGSYGGNCGGVALSDTGNCMVSVPCPGSYGAWGSFGQCSESCQSNTNVAPTQTRTRVCSGGTFGGGCTGPSSETINCNAAVPCQGTLTQWSAYGACSASCQLGLTAPTYSRTRQCVGNTFGGNCNAGVLSQVSDCNVEVSCPGELTQWSDWGNCPETCQTGAQPSVLSRARQCINKSYGGNCGAATLSETKTCSANVPCPGILSQWQSWGDCSASCQLGSTSPTRNRVRTCTSATLGANCGGVALREDASCNVQVGCPGTLTLWGEWTTCSETCQSNQNMAPSKARIRFCLNTSYDGTCFNAVLEEKVSCNELVICPRLGSWMDWQGWSDCSQTCNPGVQARNRTCTMGFPATAGDNCAPGDGRQTRVCNLGDCPVECPISKRCNCSLAAQFVTAPALTYFGTSDVQIDQVVSLLNYWTPELQNQVCDSCSIPRLTASLNTLNSHMAQVANLRATLDNIKLQLRDIINCNNNVYIGDDLWKIYDYLWRRYTMLNGVYTELMAAQMRFNASLESCKKYGTFHTILKQFYRKW